MKHFRQGPNECFPTAIACYMERDPEQIIEEILGPDLAPYSWTRLTLNPFNPLFQMVENRVHRFLARRLNWLPFRAFIQDTREPFTLEVFPEKLEGKGFLTFVLFDGMKYKARHIIAFENGIVYDTNQSYPVDYIPYREAQRQRNRLVDGIYLEPRKEGN